MAPGPRFHRGINSDELKSYLKHHLKLELSYNNSMKRIEIELLWKDDPDVPDYVEEPEVLARDGLFVENFMEQWEKR